MRILTLLLIVTLTACGGKAPQDKNTTKNLDSLVLLYPDSLPLLITYGSKLLDEYKNSEALPFLAKAYRLDTNNLETRYLYASALVNRLDRTVPDVDASQKLLLSVIKKQPGNKKALVDLASTYTLQGDYDRSFQYVNEALRIDKRYKEAYVLKGMNYRAMGNRKLAKSSFETAVQQDPKFFMGYIQLGWLYTEDAEYKYALEYFRTAAELEPTSSDALYGIAYSLQQLEKYPEALEGYRHLLQTDTSFYLALFNQGYIKQFNQKQVDSAVYFYKSAIEMRPDFVKGWHNLGLCYLEKGNKGTAYTAFIKALEYNPDYEPTRHAILKCK